MITNRGKRKKNGIFGFSTKIAHADKLNIIEIIDQFYCLDKLQYILFCSSENRMMK